MAAAGKLSEADVRAAATAGMSVRQTSRHLGVTHAAIVKWKNNLGLRFRPGHGTEEMTHREAAAYRELTRVHGYRRDEALVAIGRHDLRDPAAPAAGRGPAAPDTPTATAGPTYGSATPPCH